MFDIRRRVSRRKTYRHDSFIPFELPLSSANGEGEGVLYAIGGSLLYSPAMFYVDEWFVKKKGLAFGVMWAGVGAVRGKTMSTETVI